VGGRQWQIEIFGDFCRCDRFNLSRDKVEDREGPIKWTVGLEAGSH
jgi:hypothetical protein